MCVKFHEILKNESDTPKNIATFKNLYLKMQYAD